MVLTTSGIGLECNPPSSVSINVIITIKCHQCEPKTNSVKVKQLISSQPSLTCTNNCRINYKQS